MRLAKLFITLVLASLLSGCLCMGCFVPQLPPPPKPHIENWQRTETSAETRLADWQACGGHKSGDFAMDSKNSIEGEDVLQAYKRQSAEHQRCLIRKGYRYSGHCSTVYMKSMPACGAP
jgi:hypothetical protein